MTADADEFKNSGNDFFKNGKTNEAIEMYTKAIEVDGGNHVYFSNRSAAYLKKGEAENALADANACLKLTPDFDKGYSRKGAALQALKKFDESIAAYEEGIEKHPENEKLKAELEKVKLAKEASSDLSRAARNSRASMMASLSQQKKAEAAQDISQFVQVSKASLELQIFALQAQLELVNALAEMTDEQKMQMLFQLVDADQDGKIDARELAGAIRRRNADLSFSESIERAISFVAAFDDDHDARLDINEFKVFLNTFAETMEASFHEVSEFLILQNMFSESGNTEGEEIAGELVEGVIDEAVKDQEIIYDAMSDPRMVALFALFDKDGTGDITFNEAAVGLWQLTDNMEESAKAAVNVLLMMSEDDDRTLDYEGFSQLILSITGASGMSFDEAADDMTLAMLQEKTISEEDLLSLMVGEAVYNEAKEMIAEEKEAEAILDALQFGRLQKLFEIWDSDGDEQISFEELVNGMRKFQGRMELEESVQRAAMLMIGFDEDQSQTLDKIEFARAMVKYAKAAEVPLDDLVDFMCVVSVMEENSPQEKAFFHSIAPQTTVEIEMIEKQMELLGIE